MAFNRIIVDLNVLTAISPVDGRYFEMVKPLTPYFSEYGLMRYRLEVEVEYFISMSATVTELEDFPVHTLNDIRKIYKQFSEKDATEIKEIEKTTNHDVKAVEYFIKKKFNKLRLDDFKEFVHFGLTSQDINNTAIPLLLKEFLEKEYMALLDILLNKLNSLAKEWKDIPDRKSVV